LINLKKRGIQFLKNLNAISRNKKHISVFTMKDPPIVIGGSFWHSMGYAKESLYETEVRMSYHFSAINGSERDKEYEYVPSVQRART